MPPPSHLAHVLGRERVVGEGTSRVEAPARTARLTLSAAGVCVMYG